LAATDDVVLPQMMVVKTGIAERYSERMFDVPQMMVIKIGTAERFELDAIGLSMAGRRLRHAASCRPEHTRAAGAGRA
jgi:hypothetical protein